MIKFGPWPISHNEIFFNSAHSYGIVNIKPVVPGHVLVLPKRITSRFHDLSKEEVRDLWLSAQEIGKVIEREYAAESLTLTIQDGTSAGQTVPHVHIHIIPRIKGDWMDNDEIYPTINHSEKEMKQELQKRAGPDNESRKPRSKEEMWAEASRLKQFFKFYEDIWVN
jgi:bis(5'-adenosyl)-triphosphatase